ncbi:MAG: tRNA (uridine(34)/cytosine(34)/5-carboxymethylaminomethyluridine(34)-2'-O)-methyltransferase TrmL [Pseudomonadota bacterium]
MFHIALFEPEIPPNTGNIIRLCANTGAHLHLIEPLGFSLDDKSLRRAGLDYREYANVNTYKDFVAFRQKFSDQRIFSLTTKGQTSCYDFTYSEGDVFLFGPETRGLPPEIRDAYQSLRIPMRTNSRSLNLSNAVAIVIYEALRQTQFNSL